MAVDRCIAIVSPLKARKIRVNLIITIKNISIDYLQLNRFFIYVAVRGLLQVFYQLQMSLSFDCISLVPLDFVPQDFTNNRLVQDIVFI